MAGPAVAVVGGGCAGVLVARELLRCTGGDVLLIEPGRPGGGLAYGNARPWHLLNSRAGAMSADPDDPGHFVRWANARGIPAAGGDFLSRRDYGDYLRETFADTAAAHPGRLRVLSAAATAVRPVSRDDVVPGARPWTTGRRVATNGMRAAVPRGTS